MGELTGFGRDGGAAEDSDEGKGREKSKGGEGNHLRALLRARGGREQEIDEKGREMPKLTVELNERLNGYLEDLAKEQGIAKTQVLRRAIGLLRYMEQKRRLGKRLVITP